MVTSDLPEVFFRSLYKERVRPHRKELSVAVAITLSTGQAITIPAGFVSDLASVPRLFWGIITPSGRHDLAAIIHDYLLEQGYSRKFADTEMLYWLTVSNVSFLKRQTMFRAVRAYSYIRTLFSFRLLKH